MWEPAVLADVACVLLRSVCASGRRAPEIIARPFPCTPFPFHYPLISQSVIGRYVAWVADTLRNKPQISNLFYRMFSVHWMAQRIDEWGGHVCSSSWIFAITTVRLKLALGTDTGSRQGIFCRKPIILLKVDAWQYRWIMTERCGTHRSS
jgi:hypothetical protein